MKKKQHSNGRANGSSFASEEVSFERATASYEGWMRSCTAVVSSDLRSKHEQMKESPFLFLRGTFYRWAQMWPSICADLCGAPKVLAVGDLHVNSFGTWRDAEGAYVGASTISMSLTRWPTPTTWCVWQPA
jgi:hypothetical protein